MIYEVDKQRAILAYGRALAELEEAWPKLMKYCEDVYSEKMEQYSQEVKRFEDNEKENKDIYEKAMKKYNTERKIYEDYKQTFSDWFRNKEGPQRPIMPLIYPGMGFLTYPYYPKMNKEMFEQPKLRITNALNLASGIIGPLMLSREDILFMVSCEDGNYVKALLKETK